MSCRTGARPPSPGTEHASHGVVANAEPSKPVSWRLLGSPRDAAAGLFPYPPRFSPTVTCDRAERFTGHSPLRRAPLQSSFDPTAALAFRREHLPNRVSALFATSLQRVHSLRGFPSPRYVPPPGVHNLSTAFSALQLVGMFHPTAASRTSHSGPVQGFSLSAQPPSFFRRSCPRAVDAWAAHRRIGCHEPCLSTSRHCSMQSRVPRARRLGLTHDRSPPRVSCSSRFHPGRCLRLPEGKHPRRSASGSLLAFARANATTDPDVPPSAR